jgi:hypothetical protein
MWTTPGAERGLPQLMALRRGAAERLLAEHVLARAQRRQRRLRVEVVRTDVVEQLDRRILDQHAPVGRRTLEAVAARRLGRALRPTADDLDEPRDQWRRPGDVADGPQGMEVGLADEAVAEHPDTEARHCHVALGAPCVHAPPLFPRSGKVNPRRLG